MRSFVNILRRFVESSHQPEDFYMGIVQLHGRVCFCSCVHMQTNLEPLDAARTWCGVGLVEVNVAHDVVCLSLVFLPAHIKAYRLAWHMYDMSLHQK